MCKYALFVMMFLLSGCSPWNGQYLSWDFFNPWAGEKKEEQVEIDNGIDSSAFDNVNKYLWEASVEELSFMGFDKKDENNGVLKTVWKSPRSASNERFKIVVKVKNKELRADALDIKIYKEIKSKTGWRKAKSSHAFYVAVEQKIINRAKVLYVNDRNKEF